MKTLVKRSRVSFYTKYTLTSTSYIINCRYKIENQEENLKLTN